jgi:hypothetical protein
MLSLFKKPTPLMEATKHLQEAQHARLSHTSMREYHEAMEKMLFGRISRLQRDIDALNPKDEP